MKTALQNLLLVFIIMLSFCKTFSQSKTDGVQIADYKPEAAKSGKDGDHRWVLIKLFRMANSGKDGSDGKAGASVRINIAAIPAEGNNVVLQIVSTTNTKSSKDTFFVDPQKGQIKFIADGGNGGSGGAGGTGLSKDGKKSATSGGSGGDGGKGGKGGNIEVYFDSTAFAFINCPCLIYSNEGGRGGYKGQGGAAAADYTYEPGKGTDGKNGAAGDRGLPVYIRKVGSDKIFLMK
ncbi:hypothetical protein [Ferruginibacter sp. SUN106]|uniref:hypothetical protein n=1 Tax=Ferruginibacter sp. SUN106 TaxID=2978348 RepID=UPI003D369767